MEETGAGGRKLSNHQHDERNHISKRARWCNGTSYLDALPENVMANIIRFTSEAPRSASWDSFVSESVALQLLESKSPFATSARDLFRSVHATRNVCEYRNSGLCVFSSNFGSRILSALREFLTEIKVDRFPARTAWKLALTTKFPNLKRLSPHSPDPRHEFNLSKILGAQSENLEFLNIDKHTLSADDVRAIEKVGPRLKGLHLSIEKFETEMGPTWKSVGSNLEELLLRHPYANGNIDIPSITRNCKKIRKLSLCVSVREWDNIESLCKSLGNQLSLLALDAYVVDAQCLGRIAAACENVAIELRQGLGCRPPGLIAVGAKASHVEIGPMTFEFERNPWETLRLAGERCKNLSGITVLSAIPPDSMQAFLCQQKPSLLEFKAMLEPELETRFVVEALTRNVSSLEIFEMHGMLPAISVFEDFAFANPSLRMVTLVEERWREYACNFRRLMTAGRLTKVFLQCEKIKEISIRCHHEGHCGRSEDCATACLGARHRNVAVTICGYQYS